MKSASTFEGEISGKCNVGSHIYYALILDYKIKQNNRGILLLEKKTCIEYDSTFANSKKSHNGRKGAEFHYLGKFLIIVKVHIFSSLFYWAECLPILEVCISICRSKIVSMAQ